MTPNTPALAAEFIGTGALLTGVVGSGIMAERLSPTNPAVALLANAVATGLVLYVAISILGPVSRAHFNPLVTLAAIFQREMSLRPALGYVVAQVAGAIIGVALAHAMFDLPLLQAGTRVRFGFGQWIGEVVAAAGLLITIAGFGRFEPRHVAAGVGTYIAAAYWFTSSTSFANPAVTVARSLTDTFAGIRPSDVLPFIASQLFGGVVGLTVSRLLFGPWTVKPYD